MKKHQIHAAALLITLLSSSLLASFTNNKLDFQASPVFARSLGQEEAPDAPTTIYLPSIMKPATIEWATVAANPQRTSWTPEEVSGYMNVEWYRPIEAYISQNVQVIASDGKLFISTSRGLYVLNATNGSLVWRFDTELPLGNSPTVANGVVYVGGYDRKIHALDARSGQHLWEFSGAQAGYDTNPLVIEGKVFVGNRDGYMYAIGAHNQPNQGQLVWKFKTDASIHQSAAYKNSVIYFASDDNYAYAVRTDNGGLVWKSDKLPGDGYHLHWPIVLDDKVIFTASVAYRHDMGPGSRSVLDDEGDRFTTYNGIQLYDIFYGLPLGSYIGQPVSGQTWANGHPVITAASVLEYMENNPNSLPNAHKPWRRNMIMLNLSNGSEYTFDSDNDGYGEYAPFVYYGTKNGNRNPPVVFPTGIVYNGNVYQYTNDSQGKIMGWKPGTPYLSIVGGQGALAEPQALSGGGNLVYRNLCCDRVGDYVDTRANSVRSGSLWSYSLAGEAPNYDEMWTILPGLPRLQGWYKGTSNSINGIYHNHGDQNPLVPYQGRIFVHRSNAIIAYGKGPQLGKLPAIPIQNVQTTLQTPTTDELKARLEGEIQKIIDAGHLRPGYYNDGAFTHYDHLTDYYENPGDTLYTLSFAYPHLSAALQNQTRSYLQREFSDYFDPIMYTNTGWAEGAAREAMPLPPEVQNHLSSFQKRQTVDGFTWRYPPFNFYAMWKYAAIEPQNVSRIYELAKSKIEVPIPSPGSSTYYDWYPYELNAYIAGYIGFLNLQQQAGMAQTDAALRTSVTNELNRLLQYRANNFQKDSPWIEDYYHKRPLLIARNFMWLTPELGDYLHANALSRVQEAINEYEYVAPYWFVAKYEAMPNESTMSNLYTGPAMYQARAYILKENRSELTKYLDSPAFLRGDLMYIQNLVAAIQVP
jgi:hypothetical protein